MMLFKRECKATFALLLCSLSACLLLFCSCGKNDQPDDVRAVMACVEDIFRSQLSKEIKCVDIVNKQEVAPNSYVGKVIFYLTSEDNVYKKGKYCVVVSYEIVSDNVVVNPKLETMQALAMTENDAEFERILKAEKEKRIAAAEMRRVEAEQKRAEEEKAERARIEAEQKRIEAERVAAAKARRQRLEQLLQPMVRVSAGEFTMGSGKNAHKVKITKDYYIAKYPVTQELYSLVMEDNPSKFDGADNPVENVSWDDAMAFCRKLNESKVGACPEGYRYSLPTEAQWEFAARGGSNGKGFWYSGSSTVGEVAWNLGNSRQMTHEVGRLKPNELGIYDMSGNVWEWCLDWYADYPKQAVADPAGPSSGRFRVCRGGCWSLGSGHCLVSCRNYGKQSFRDETQGFRLVLVPVQ
ncbi:MAG: SUMF1/EgtB/PvdO family nonheme iron enzyme [Victivallaceae bacterium]|nr:SUMF1/EgtB/PvdO family nonheme iron enzyme [Victivallaceae bacterium]